MNRCNAQETTCRKCAQRHQTWECDSSSVTCANCGEAHRAGDMCKKRKKENEILEVQSRLEVGRHAARQAITAISIQTNEVRNESAYLKMHVNKNEINIVCPFSIEKAMKEKYTISRENISTDATGLTIKTSVKQAYALRKISNIVGIPCKVEDHNIFNKSKRLIYLEEFDANHEETFLAGVKENYQEIEDVKRAFRVKPKNSACNSFFANFSNPKYKNIN